MIAPSVIRAGTARLKRAAEIRQREGGHLIGRADLNRRVVEGRGCLAYLPEQVPLLVRLTTVCVEPAERTEEDLTAGAELRAQADETRDFFQLVAGRRLGKHRREGRVARRGFQNG